MRFPVISAINDLLESRAALAKANAARAQVESGLLETSWSQFVDDTDAAEKGWTQLSVGNTGHTTAWEASRDSVDYLNELRSWARWMCRYDPIARSVQGNYVRYIWGTGPQIQPNDDNPQHLEAWSTFEDEQSWDQFGRNLVEMCQRDGELFIFDRAGGQIPRFRLLDPAKINTPADKQNAWESFGIKTDPKDVTKVKGYYYDDGSQSGEFISARNMLHIKINCDPWDKRGRSAYEGTIEELKDYRKFRRNRAKLHWVRTMFAIVMQTPRATPAQAAAAAAQLKVDGGTDSKGRTYGKEIKSGTIIETNIKDSVQMLAPNLQAADAFHDGREIKLCIAAAHGMSETWVTADSQNANYASQQVAESPAVRMVECKQSSIANMIIKWIYERVIFTAVMADEISETFPQKSWDMEKGNFKEEKKPADLTCTVGWPGLIHRDIKNESEALSNLVQSKIVSKRTSSTQMGYDFDREQENIMRDGEQQDDTKDPEKDQDDIDDADKPDRESRIMEALKNMAGSTKQIMSALRGDNGR